MNAALALRLRARTTALLQAAHPADPASLDRLLPLLYGELRQMAHRQLARERRGHTLRTTALVHEAYLRLVDQTKVTQRGRAYFFGAAARAMRQVLVDYARKRKAEKRGGRPSSEFDHRACGDRQLTWRQCGPQPLVYGQNCLPPSAPKRC